MDEIIEENREALEELTQWRSGRLDSGASQNDITALRGGFRFKAVFRLAGAFFYFPKNSTKKRRKRSRKRICAESDARKTMVLSLAEKRRSEMCCPLNGRKTVYPLAAVFYLSRLRQFRKRNHSRLLYENEARRKRFTIWPFKTIIFTLYFTLYTLKNMITHNNAKMKNPCKSRDLGNI